MAQLQPKVALKYKVMLVVLIVANFSLAGFLLANSRAGKPKGISADLLPTSLLESDETVQSKLNALAATTATGKAGIVIFSSVSSSCDSSRILDTIKAYHEKSDSTPFTILLPSYFTQNDVENFQHNLAVNLPIERTDAGFTKRWSAITEQYKVVASTGVVVFTDGKTVVVSRDVMELKQHLSALGESE
jgi:hypothetical protein